MISNALTRKDALSPVCYIVHEEPRAENQQAVEPEPRAENQQAAHGEQPLPENQHAYIRESSSKIKEKKMYPSDDGLASGGDFEDELQALYDKQLTKPEREPNHSTKTPG